MPGISLVLSMAIRLTLTKPMDNKSQSEQLEFSGKWKFLASIICIIQSNYICWIPILGQALCWVLGKIEK